MKNRWMTTAFAFCLVAGCAAAQVTQPDNTRTNRDDRAAGQPTADQSKDNAGDRQLSKEIRKSIQDDKNLSSYAHNVKVIAQNGKVTLKGPVRSEEEKNSIVQKATVVAGAGNVDDQLTVKAARQKRNK